jgi:hypothetical protein
MTTIDGESFYKKQQRSTREVGDERPKTEGDERITPILGLTAV